jgi:hypothetical protein
MTPNEMAESLMADAEALRKARVAEATAFLMAKASNPKITDGAAERQAIVATNGETTMAQAVYDIALIIFQGSY